MRAHHDFDGRIVVVLALRGPSLYKEPVWADLRASRLYVAKQLLAILLCMLMAAELIDAIVNGKYDYQKVAPAVQLFGMVRGMYAHFYFMFVRDRYQASGQD